MKNHFNKIIICLLMAVMSCGCGNTVKTDESCELELSTIAPDPAEVLPDAEVRIIDPPDNNCFRFMLKNVEDRKDFSKYVEKCMTGNFDFNWPGFTSHDNYQSYNWDKTYWIAVTYVPGSEEDEIKSYIYVDVRNLIAKKEK